MSLFSKRHLGQPHRDVLPRDQLMQRSFDLVQFDVPAGQYARALVAMVVAKWQPCIDPGVMLSILPLAVENLH